MAERNDDEEETYKDPSKTTRTFGGETLSDEGEDTVKKEKKEEYNLDDYDREKYPLRETVWKAPFLKDPFIFNPLVSSIGCILLWGLAIWSMADPDGSNSTLVDWKSKVSWYFTWMFIGGRAVFFFFLVYITIRYYNVKLGRPDEPPEFDNFSYFSMIFAAGVAVGLFVFGVAEPLAHLNDNWYASMSYRTMDERAMFAINLTVNNWGIAGWAPYLIVAVCMGLAGHRFRMPMTFRSCLFPVFGHYTWGWIGDIIDGVTIVVTVAGVCTSLGLGAIQIVAGFQFLGWVDEDASEDRLTSVQNLTIWAITAIASASVISGLNAGVKLLSQIAFGLGMILLATVFIMDNTKYMLNLIVQETGYFMQYNIYLLNFWTDAFAQLKPGEGRATDGLSGNPNYMDWWIVFYQAWWVSWSAFVGLFVARISRGRRIGEVIVYSMAAPIFYCIIWFCVFGGTGIRQQRQAEELEQLGKDWYQDEEYFQSTNNEYCYDVPQSTLTAANGTVIFENLMVGVTPVCKYYNADMAAFNVLNSFSFPNDFEHGYGSVLSVVFVIALAIYFATSSDSGSLIVDHLSGNGRHNHHWLQRLFWAVTEGAVATATLSAGGANALQAVQAASIVFGFPFLFLLFYTMESINSFCIQAAVSEDNMDYELPSGHEMPFPIFGGIFNIGEYIASLGNVNASRVAKNMDKPSSFHVKEFFKALFLPSLSLSQSLNAAYPRNRISNLIVPIVYGVLYYTWIGLFAAYGAVSGLIGPAWLTFFTTGTMLTSIRIGYREKFNLRSNLLGDWVSSCFMWPQVLAQFRQHCVDLDLPNDKSDEDLNKVVQEEVIAA